jgi:hypothetical protein
MTQLSRHVLETLREDGDFVLSRSTLADETTPVLVLATASEQPAPGIVARLEQEYSLRDELDSDWVVRPLALIHHEGRSMLVLENPGGEPLDRLLGPARNASALADAGGPPTDLSRFLCLAVGLATALG